MSKKNAREVVEQNLVEHIEKLIKELVEDLNRNKSKKDSAGAAQESQGWAVNLTAKVVDNVQVCIKNIHVRLEDAHLFRQPISMGVTLKELCVSTTDEDGREGFIDRTLPENANVPLNKRLSLQSLGFYCHPDDKAENLVLNKDSEAAMFAHCEELFGRNDVASAKYQAHYLLQPISLAAKIRKPRNRKPGASRREDQIESAPSVEPKIKVMLDVDNFRVSFKRSQFETVLKFLQIVEDFKMEQDAILMEGKELHLKHKE